jgi:DNA-binding response OmpR family regulator
MPGQMILVVDDEASIRQLEQLYLEREGYIVKVSGDGRAALTAINEFHPDLMVLDVMLPELDGLEVCRQVRSENNPLPIIMVTARDEDVDKILGLELGADDYLTKPFNPRELVARVKALLRRVSRQEEDREEAPRRFAGLEIDPASREVRINGQPLYLRTQEFEVLLALVENQGKVLSREKLLNLAWGYDFFGQTRTVDVHIAQLRRKLSGSSLRIETVTGVGYKLVA